MDHGTAVFITLKQEWWSGTPYCSTYKSCVRTITMTVTSTIDLDTTLTVTSPWPSFTTASPSFLTPISSTNTPTGPFSSADSSAGSWLTAPLPSTTSRVSNSISSSRTTFDTSTTRSPNSTTSGLSSPAVASGVPTESSAQSLGLIIGPVLGSIFAVLLILLFIFLWTRHRRANRTPKSKGSSQQTSPRQPFFSWPWAKHSISVTEIAPRVVDSEKKQLISPPRSYKPGVPVYSRREERRGRNRGGHGRGQPQPLQRLYEQEEKQRKRDNEQRAKEAKRAAKKARAGKGMPSGVAGQAGPSVDSGPSPISRGEAGISRDDARGDSLPSGFFSPTAQVRPTGEGYEVRSQIRPQRSDRRDSYWNRFNARHGIDSS
ncbi:hypothetical protein BT63DRAFT_451822 [Microthyrium microscopicum]|uniref:Mid2 domain-containing protein n=1 Tax=Microthyrium microscopicum TaxID=703497 RepID=A0A6A6US58_9PEZI|nr:hypothetical protein BT63DRAFT_451822 [Microthyrium microscopicum]